MVRPYSTKPFVVFFFFVLIISTISLYIFLVISYLQETLKSTWGYLVLVTMPAVANDWIGVFFLFFKKNGMPDATRAGRGRPANGGGPAGAALHRRSPAAPVSAAAHHRRGGRLPGRRQRPSTAQWRRSVSLFVCFFFLQNPPQYASLSFWPCQDTAAKSNHSSDSQQRILSNNQDLENRIEILPNQSKRWSCRRL